MLCHFINSCLIDENVFSFFIEQKSLTSKTEMILKRSQLKTKHHQVSFYKARIYFYSQLADGRTSFVKKCTIYVTMIAVNYDYNNKTELI